MNLSNMYFNSQYTFMKYKINILNYVIIYFQLFFYIVLEHDKKIKIRFKCKNLNYQRLT